jgi:integrase
VAPRPRKSNRHLPANMQFKHGAYYLTKANKWTPLGKEYGPALVKYSELIGVPVEVRTVRDALLSYIEHAKTRSGDPIAKATEEGYRYSMGHLCAVFGKLALSDLKQADVYRYLTDSGTVQANRDKALLSAAFSHARNLGAFSGPDPTKGLQYRNTETPRERYVTDAELAELVKQASPRLAVIARFIALTGMRSGDALRVRMSDMDAEGIHYQQGKTGRRLVVLWSEELTEIVEQARTLWRRFGREWLFESRPRGKHAGKPIGPYTPAGLRALWRPVRAKAGLIDVRLHDLRAKAGSDMATQGEAQGLLGHADGKTTARHYRRKPARVKPVR